MRLAVRGSVLCTAFCALWLVGCRSDWEVPALGNDVTLPNVTIADLRDYYSDAQLVINEGIIVSGRVITSTRAGNFYNTFFIDDGTGALEIMAGIPDLDATYHPGQQITVRARGLAVGHRDGVMQIGLPPEPGSRYPTGYFYHPAVIRQWVFPERNVAPVAPIEVSISDLSSELCGRLVRLSGLRIDPALDGATWAITRPGPRNGYVKFRSVGSYRPGGRRDSIITVTSGYASFAAAPVPHGEGSLTGILLYGPGDAGRNHYLLKLRDETDIEL